MTADDAGGYSASSIVALTGEQAVRRRPGMYYGTGRDDPALPGLVLRQVALATLAVPPARDMLTVVVTIEDDLVFSVTDDGDGICPHQRHPRRGPDLQRVLTDIHGGAFARDGQIGIAAALCTRVSVRTWWEGVQYAADMDSDRTVSEVKALAPSTAPGTVIRFHLDAGYFTPHAQLPEPSPALLAPLLTSRKRPADILTIVDNERGTGSSLAQYR